MSMSYFVSHITSQLEFHIVHDGDMEFYDTMSEILSNSSNSICPTRSLESTTCATESFLNFKGILVVRDELLNDYDPEEIGPELYGDNFECAGYRNNPLNVDKVLVCKFINAKLLTTFCQQYGVDYSTFISDSVFVFWTLDGVNSYSFPRNFRPSLKNIDQIH